MTGVQTCALPISVLEELQQYFKLEKSKDSFSDLGLIFSTTVLGFKTAAEQRRRALLELSKKYAVTIYSNSDTRELFRVRYGGSQIGRASCRERVWLMV